MKFSEFLMQKLQQYSYEKRRDFSRYKKGRVNHSFWESVHAFIEELDDVDDYIDEKIEGIEDLLPKRRK